MTLLFQPLQQINFIPSGVLNIGHKSISCSKRFLAFSSFFTLYVYDLTNFRLVRLVTTSNSIIKTILFSKQNDNFIAIATNYYVAIYDVVNNCQVSYTYTQHTFSTMCWIPNDSIVIGFSSHYDVMFFFESQVETHKQTFSNVNVDDQLYDPNHAYFNIQIPLPENIKKEDKTHRIQFTFYDTYMASSILLKQKTIFILGCEGGQICRVDFADVKFDFFKAGKDCGIIKGIDFDPFNTSNCLTVWSSGLIILLDLSTDKMFEIHRTKIDSNLAGAIFLSSPPGHFLTGNESNGVLQIWSSTSNDPIEKITVGSCGLVQMDRASSSIKNLKDCIVLGFADGSITIYDFYKKEKIWQNYSAHTNTVFDVQLLPTNPDVLVSLGAEGSVCTWDIDDATPIDRFVIEKDNFICMTITHGSGYIICGCQSGSIAAFSIKMLKIIFKKKIFESRVRSIDSSPHQPGLILITSERGECYLFNIEKNEVVWSPPSQMLTIQNYPNSKKDDDDEDDDNNSKKSTNLKCICTTFSPHQDKTYAISCSCGTLLLIRASSYHQFNTDDKYDLACVLWNPHDENMILTTSDSGRVTRWKIFDNNDYETKVITNHNGKSRGISFHPTFDWMAASTGYDGCIHIFNVLTCEVYCQVSAHCDPAYGLTFSPTNPYLLISSAADTAIKFWSLDKLFQDKEDYLSSVFSKSAEKYTFRPIEGFQELKSLLIRLDKDNANLNDEIESESKNSSVSFKEGSIMHINDCIRIIKKRIRRMLSASPHETSMIKKAIKSRERMLNAARLSLLTGNRKKYCELLFAAGEYDKALAAAPSVSYEFWRNLMKERMKLYEETNDKVNCKIIIGEISESIKDMLNEKDEKNFVDEEANYNKAMLIAASRIFSERSLKIAQIKSAENDNNENEIKFKYSDLLFISNERLFEYSVASKASKFYLLKGKVFKAASCLLSVGDLRSAINLLEINGEIMAASFIAKKFNLLNKNLAFKLMKINSNYTWKYLPTELQVYTFPLLSIEDQKKNYDYVLTLIKKEEASNSNIARQMFDLILKVNQGDDDSHAKIKNAISIGFSFLEENLQNKIWDFSSVKDVLNVFQLIDTESFSQKNLYYLNSLDFYVAAFDAMWKGFGKIIPRLIEIGEFLALKIKAEHPWISNLYKNLKSIANKFNSEQYCTIVPTGCSLLGSNFLTLNDSNNHQEKILLQELLMWQQVTTFSPTGSCNRVFYV